MCMLARQVAIDTIKKYQTRNPFDIIMGMKNVILVSAPLSDIRGFYQYFKRNYIIYIDENLSEHEKVFVCAHELGHVLIHPKANHIYMDAITNFNTDKFEIEANKFALELLISDEEVLEYSTYSEEQLARLWGYSVKLVQLRLQNEKR